MTTIPEGLQGALDRVAGWVSGTGRDKDMQLIREHIAASQQQVERLQQANAGLVQLAEIELGYAPAGGFVWFHRNGQAWTGKAHATMREAFVERRIAIDEINRSANQ